MCGFPRGGGAPRILVAGRNLVYQGMHGQYAYPDGDHNSKENILRDFKPVYAIIVRRKPHAPLY